MTGVRVPDVRGIHAEKAGNEGQRQKDDSDESEDENGGLLTIFGGFDAADILKCRKSLWSAARSGIILWDVDL